MSLDTIADIYLAVFYSFVAVFYTLLIKLRSAAEQGCRMVHPGSAYSLHWWNHLVFRIMRILIWSFCVFRLFFESIDSYALLFPLADNIVVRFAGLILLTSGFAYVIRTNIYLGKQWRSGVDTKAPQKLIQSGPYHLSRNPTYIGVAAGQIGFFLALPSAFTLFCLLIGLSSLNIQIHLEEMHLKSRFGKEYAHYCQYVPKWIRFTRPRS